MTEVPEHLLKRSKDRRTSLDGGSPDATEAAPAAQSLPPLSLRPRRNQFRRMSKLRSSGRRSPTGPCPCLLFCRCGPSFTSEAFRLRQMVSHHNLQQVKRSSPPIAPAVTVLEVAVASDV